MTAVPDWDVVRPRDTDAELVLASLAGDRTAFAQMYDRYADRLHDFCVGMLRDRDCAADCVQDAFCIAATRLPQLREPDKLRPWLYSIARNEALRVLRERRRETPAEDLPDEVSDEPSPETLAARTELADLVSEAAGGLSDRDQAVLELAYRHGLDGPELADALGVSQSNANTMVGRLRDTIERSLGALLVARRVQSKPARCAELAAILDGWDGHFNVLMRKRIARHIESCPTCDEERGRLVSPTALLGATPIFIPAPEWLRDRTLGEVQLISMEGELETVGSSHTDDDGGRRRTRGWMLAVALLVAALGAVLGLSYALMQQEYVGITPTDATDTEPVSEPPSTPALTHTTAAVQTTPSALPPAQTPTQTPEAPTPEVVATTPVYEPPVDRTPVDEPTHEVIPSKPPSSPPSSVPNGSTPRLTPRLTPTSRPQQTGIAGIPQTPSPQSPNRRAVKPPAGSRAPAPSR
jgi:RNA polymerase sigma factor (sigma-70 family)